MEEKIESGTIMISVRLNKEVKTDAEALFSELGMNMTTAINVFLRRCLMENKIPFEVGLRKPNAETIAAIEELEAMRRGEMPERVMTWDAVEEFLRISAEDPELTVDKFIERKRVEKELELKRRNAEGHAAIQKLLGIFKGDPELTVDKFLERKRAEKELEL